MNISFSMAKASLPTSLSVIFRSSLSLTLVTRTFKILHGKKHFPKGLFVLCDSHLLYRMSVSERRMFCLIWLFGGGGTGDAGGAEEAE